MSTPRIASGVMVLVLACGACGGAKAPPPVTAPPEPPPAEADAGAAADETSQAEPAPPTVLDARSCVVDLTPNEHVQITLEYDGTTPKLARCRRLSAVAPLRGKAAPSRTYWEVIGPTGVTYRVSEPRSPQCNDPDSSSAAPEADAGPVTSYVVTSSSHRRPFAAMRVLPVTADTSRVVLHDAPCDGKTSPFVVIELR